MFSSVCDLLRHGYKVAVAGDAIASRDPDHVRLAEEQMRAAGALVLPVESLLFRWQRQAGVGVFKDMSRLVR